MMKTKVIIAVIVAVMGMGFIGGKALAGNNTEAEYAGDCEVYSEDFTGGCEEGEFEDPMEQEYADCEEAVVYSDDSAADCCASESSSAARENVKSKKKVNSCSNSVTVAERSQVEETEVETSEDIAVMACTETEVGGSEEVREKVFEAIQNEIPGTWEYRDDVKGAVATLTFAEDGTVRLEAYNEYYNDEEIVSGTWKLVREDNKAVLVRTLAGRCFPRENEFELDNFYFNGNVDLSGLGIRESSNVAYCEGTFSKID